MPGARPAPLMRVNFATAQDAVLLEGVRAGALRKVCVESSRSGASGPNRRISRRWPTLVSGSLRASFQTRFAGGAHQTSRIAVTFPRARPRLRKHRLDSFIGQAAPVCSLRISKGDLGVLQLRAQIQVHRPDHDQAAVQGQRLGVQHRARFAAGAGCPSCPARCSGSARAAHFVEFEAHGQQFLAVAGVPDVGQRASFDANELVNTWMRTPRSRAAAKAPPSCPCRERSRARWSGARAAPGRTGAAGLRPRCRHRRIAPVERASAAPRSGLTLASTSPGPALPHRPAVGRDLGWLVDQHHGRRPDEGGLRRSMASGPRRRRCSVVGAALCGRGSPSGGRVAPSAALSRLAARLVAQRIEFLAGYQRLHRIGALVVPVAVEAARQFLDDRAGRQHVQVHEIGCLGIAEIGVAEVAAAGHPETLSAMKSLLCMRCWMREASSTALNMWGPGSNRAGRVAD